MTWRKVLRRFLRPAVDQELERHELSREAMEAWEAENHRVRPGTEEARRWRHAEALKRWEVEDGWPAREDPPVIAGKGIAPGLEMWKMPSGARLVVNSHGLVVGEITGKGLETAFEAAPGADGYADMGWVEVGGSEARKMGEATVVGIDFGATGDKATVVMAQMLAAGRVAWAGPPVEITYMGEPVPPPLPPDYGNGGIEPGRERR